MKKSLTFFSFFIFIVISNNSFAQKKSKSIDENYLIGTYTDNASQGINVIKFDAKSKQIKLLSTVLGVENPSFVITNNSKTIVVAVEEIASENGGKVTSFYYNKKAKTFIKINSFNTKGNHPCTVAFSPKEDFVLVGNYSGGNLSVFPIDAKGKLSEMSNFIQYEGKSANVERQEKPHVHCIAFHPKENIIAVADLGTDAIELIPFDENSKTFLQNEKALSTKVAAGSGPRHLVWNKAGTILYVTFELTNEVGVFQHKDGKLTQIQTLALTNPTKSGSAAELRLSNDGQFLYASVRGNDNQIVVMKTDNLGKFNVIQTIKTASMPRNFILTKNQKNILVATQGSNLISVFDRNEKTGLLTATSNEITINKPVYLFPF
ncbi:lactonase family protein [Flavobacterium sp. SUN052]|uniref:lactonase family protein n=1 Tax=Flavobacterium sp. SUN052 TaxID=3002441 RepID=UPI00237D5E7D|nr:lactonase family protein [Flavobacterium sp. SUN052]MEC4003742.1 lactonase family protein [Flavobacterium sp. SUN052]